MSVEHLRARYNAMPLPDLQAEYIRAVRQWRDTRQRNGPDRDRDYEIAGLARQVLCARSRELCVQANEVLNAELRTFSEGV